MRVTYKTDRMDITVDGADVKACFDELAKAMEVFGETVCGACQSNDVAFVHRENDGYTFREAQCRECGHALAFGLKKSDLSMFPRRKDKAGNWLDNEGWGKFSRQQDQGPF